MRAAASLRSALGGLQSVTRTALRPGVFRILCWHARVCSPKTIAVAYKAGLLEREWHKDGRGRMHDAEQAENMGDDRDQGRD